MSDWYTIGGGVKKGESPLAAILREIQEEVGIIPASLPKIFSVYYSHLEKRDDYIILYLLELKDFKQNENVTSWEIKEKKWFSFDNLPLDTSPATKRRIEEYLGMQTMSDIW